ncbi:MAG: immunity 41 family protein [Oscillospiraceae bacterium]|nr:immunity 41 family protein [Oscillospiraceae bacterium]
MNVREARAVLYRNASCSKKSLIYSLHEREKFSEKRFWEFYDCVIALARNALENGRDIETAQKITAVYQWVLKEMIWHFDKRDGSVLKKFPKKYNDYIERLDGAADAYFRGVFVNESLYELQRPKGRKK